MSKAGREDMSHTQFTLLPRVSGYKGNVALAFVDKMLNNVLTGGFLFASGGGVNTAILASVGGMLENTRPPPEED